MKTWALAVGVLVAGCDGDPATKPDAAPDPDAAIDARPLDAPVPHCTLSKPFAIVPNEDLLTTTGYEDAPWLTTDELTMYYGSAVPGGNWDIIEATRTSRDLPFSNPHPIALSTAVNERFPALTDDRLTMFATREVGSPNPSSRIVVSHRASTSEVFPPLDYDPNLAAMPSSYDSAVSVLPDRSAVWPSNGQMWISRWNGTTYEAAEKWTTLDGAEGGVLSGDRLTVYTGKTFNNPTQIYMATRGSVTAAFGTPSPVPELASTGSDYPRWVSRDGCTLTFTRYVSANQLDMYVAQRPL
jgi:hypothetical protein